MIAPRRLALRAMVREKRAASGGSSKFSASVSAYPRMEVMGVRSSWLTLATNSVRSDSKRRSSVRSSSTSSSCALATSRESGTTEQLARRSPVTAENGSSASARRPVSRALAIRVSRSGLRTISIKRRPSTARSLASKSRTAAGLMVTMRSTESSATIPTGAVAKIARNSLSAPSSRTASLAAARAPRTGFDSYPPSAPSAAAMRRCSARRCRNNMASSAPQAMATTVAPTNGTKYEAASSVGCMDAWNATRLPPGTRRTGTQRRGRFRRTQRVRRVSCAGP